MSAPPAASDSADDKGPDDAALRAALAAPGLTERLAVHYRPIVTLTTGVVASIAARIRFTDPILAQAPPSAWCSSPRRPTRSCRLAPG